MRFVVWGSWRQLFLDAKLEVEHCLPALPAERELKTAGPKGPNLTRGVTRNVFFNSVTRKSLFDKAERESLRKK